MKQTDRQTDRQTDTHSGSIWMAFSLVKRCGQACCTAVTQCPTMYCCLMKIAMEWIHESNADDDSVTVPVSLADTLTLPDTPTPLSLAESDVGGLWYAVPDVQMIDVRSVSHWKSTGYADNAAAWTNKINHGLYGSTSCYISHWP